jgi:TolA-binding protein
MDNLFIRLAVICLLAFLGFEASKELKKPDREAYIENNIGTWRAEGKLAESEQPTDALVPPSKVQNAAKLLTYFVILAAGVGFVTLKWIIPMLGDALNSATFAANDKSPYTKATDLITAGKYHEALAAFQKLASARPTDKVPVMEMYKLNMGRFQDSDGAIETLRSALERPWPEEDTAFFATKLANLYYEEKGDISAAKQVYEFLISAHPDTTTAANAAHKIRELEEAEFLASRNQA